MLLPDTSHRCHDRACGARHRCERWRQRDQAGPSSVHAMTLKPGWYTHDGPCPHMIRTPLTIDALLEQGPAGWLIAGWLLGHLPRDVHLARLSPARARTGTQHACWTARPQPHPWHPQQISDIACGYDDRLTDRACQGCRRARTESPLDQLQALDPQHSEDGRR